MKKDKVVKKSLVKTSKIKVSGKKKLSSEQQGQIDKMPLVMKAIIVMLSSVILVLMGYILYQFGKNSTTNVRNKQEVNVDDSKNVEDVIPGDIVDIEATKNNVITNDTSTSTNNFGGLNNSSGMNNADNNQSSNDISEQDIKKIEVELDGISSEYDDLKDLREILSSWFM